MLSRNFLTVFLLIIVIDLNDSFNFKKTLNNAITKAKAFYKKRFGKDKTWHFLGYDPTEYPGTDEKLRKISRDKWEDYYKCLQEQEESLGNHGSIIPEAVLAFEGESIKFECKVCLSPSEREDMESVEWDWSSIEKEYLEPVEFTEHTLVSPEDKTLHLYNLGTQHTGQYVCKLRNQLTAPYFLTVVNTSEPMREVRKRGVTGHKHPEIPWLIQPDIVLDSMWGKWSPCSHCDIVGKRHKFGYCIIILLTNIENETDNSSLVMVDSNSTNINETENIDNEADTENFKQVKRKITLSKIERDILHIFKFGIPCRSHILPKTIKNIIEVRIRKSEIMTGFCKIKCPEDQVFVVRDRDGKILETANNSAGVYSMMQGLPNIEPPVERRLQFEAKDSKITLTCPGNLNSDTPVQWQIGSKNVVPSLLFKESSGRIFVSIMDRIQIKKARISDSNIYSCWQNKELAGTIRLVIEKRLKLDFNHHIMLLGIIIIMSTFLFVFVKAFLGRKHARV